MQFCLKQVNEPGPGVWRIALLLALSLLLPGLTQAKGFTIRSVETRLQDGVYLLNTRVDFSFSGEAQKALQSGIPIILLLDIELEKERSWWWSKTVATLQQGYLLLYHALSEKQENTL